MTKTLMTLAAAATIAVVAVAAPTDAQARRGWWGPGAVIGGLAAGAYGPYGYGPGYGYYGGPAYAYGPGCYLRRERVWDGYGYRWRRVRVCY
jgi:hypothetical protein